MLILDTKEVNRIIIGILTPGAKFTLMFAFQEISCQNLAAILYFLVRLVSFFLFLYFFKERSHSLDWMVGC